MSVSTVLQPGDSIPTKIEDIPDEYLEAIFREIPGISMSTPWQYDPGTGSYGDPSGRTTDADGYSATLADGKDESPATREYLQEQCWLKFQRTPQVNTAIRGLAGRMSGYGFESASSDIEQIQDAIEEIELDPRNRLYNFWPKYTVRSIIEGELRVCCTVHNDGFIEIDFIDPSCVRSSNVESGIIYHPFKTTMPLIYCIKRDDDSVEEQIPSIFIARYPELMAIAKKQKGFSNDALKGSRKSKFKSIGGFNRFIIEWDKSYITKRNIGHSRTILEWLNHWENLKKYEIDHKKSAGAYVYTFQFTDIRSWIEWLRMSDDDRLKTGIAAPKTPGSSLVLGPNMEAKVMNPNLPNISESDTDILHQVTSGLNEAADVTTGQSSGTFASVKESRGPMSDRVSDEVSYFEKFLRYDFWGGVFFLKSKVSKFPETFKVREAVSFKNKEPIFKERDVKPERLIEISFPTSETNDPEARSRAFFGSKHASLHDTAGIPLSELVKKMGFGNHRKLRLRYETEKEMYPELPLNMDAESVQETLQAEPAQPKPGEPKKDGSGGGTRDNKGRGDTPPADQEKTGKGKKEKKSGQDGAE